jgi:hypothetical protein
MPRPGARPSGRFNADGTIASERSGASLPSWTDAA